MKYIALISIVACVVLPAIAQKNDRHILRERRGVPGAGFPPAFGRPNGDGDFGKPPDFVQPGGPGTIGGIGSPMIGIYPPIGPNGFIAPGGTGGHGEPISITAPVYPGSLVVPRGTHCPPCIHVISGVQGQSSREKLGSISVPVYPSTFEMPIGSQGHPGIYVGQIGPPNAEIPDVNFGESVSITAPAYSRNFGVHGGSHGHSGPQIQVGAASGFEPKSSAIVNRYPSKGPGNGGVPGNGLKGGLPGNGGNGGVPGVIWPDVQGKPSDRDGGMPGVFWPDVKGEPSDGEGKKLMMMIPLYDECLRFTTSRTVTQREMWTKREIGPSQCRGNIGECFKNDMEKVRCKVSVSPSPQCIAKVAQYMQGNSCNRNGGNGGGNGGNGGGNGGGGIGGGGTPRIYGTGGENGKESESGP